ncbi:MAG: hypothetical protein ACXIVD_04080 [Salinarimonas sp.]
MQVHTSPQSNQPAQTTNHADAAVAFARARAAEASDAVAAAAKDTQNQALLEAAIGQIGHDMHAHGGGHLAGIAQQILRDGAQTLLADPGADFAQNLDILRGHVLHHVLVRGGLVEDPAAPLAGPISVPRHREDGTLDTYLVAFPDIPGVPETPGAAVPEGVALPPGIGAQEAQRIALSEKRHELAHGIAGQMAAHGAPYLQGEAQMLFLQATAGGPDIDNPFAGQNLEIMAAHIGYHLLARNGNIDDPAAPREGSIQVPQHLPSGELHFVEVAMERLNQSG